MTRFEDTWTRPVTPGLGTRLGDTLHPPGPLKPRIKAAVNSVHQQVGKLDAILAKLKDKDTKLFQKVVAATQQHDAHASKVLSSELAEVRKDTKVLSNTRIGLEQIELRLTTCSDIGDTVMTIMPTVGLMRGIQSSLARFMPGADQEIGKMTEMLGGLMTETFTGDSAFGSSEVSSEESEKILQEAAAVAENSVGTRFPSTPFDLDEHAKAAEPQQQQQPGKFV